MRLFFESIPGEIIGWTSTDAGKDKQTDIFQIQNNKFVKVNTTLSESDLKKLDKYASKESKFELNNDYLDAFKYPSVGTILKNQKKENS